jgi:hypothetical protein
MKRLISIVLCLACIFSCSGQKDNVICDVCIYGGSSSGVVAAVAAARLGKKVLLVSPDLHLGGLSASGLGFTDIGNKYAVTGLARDFYRKVGREYGALEEWNFEPHRAEKVFMEYLQAQQIEMLLDYHLQAVDKAGTEIRSIRVRGRNLQEGRSRTVRARQYIDATYVGDLMAAAGVSFTVGRESNSVYNETFNGVQLLDKHQFPPVGGETCHIDPYRVEGDPSSGLCWGISDAPLAPLGSGDNKVQAYNYRLCLTQDPENMVAFTKPAGYDSLHYELLRRLINRRHERGWKQMLDWFYLRIKPVANGKADVNNKGPFSTDFIGMNYEYPEAGYDQRRIIEQAHEEYIKGLLYFLSHDRRLPEYLRNEMATWGWAKDEFIDNGHFPYKMYIREARRMVGELVMTEHHCTGREVVEDPIGLAAYTMDSHNCQRIVVENDNGVAMVRNEGDVQVGGFPPYPIGYGALTPRREQCTNLLVPVCLSASHIAYGSIRMEPVFMVLGQVAAGAAVMAIDSGTSVQEIDVAALQEKLTTDPLFDGTAPDVIVDNEDTVFVTWRGDWSESDVWMGQYKTSCRVAENRIGNAVTFKAAVEEEGIYGLYYHIPARGEQVRWADDIEVVVNSGQAGETLSMDLERYNADWYPLGTRHVAPGEQVLVSVSGAGGEGYIPADAVLLVPQVQD